MKLNKFGPVLNQLAIEDAAKLDEAISFFYENQRWPKGENLRLFGRVDFIIWKRQAPYSLFCLRPVNLESVIKIWLDERQEDQFGRNEVLSFIPESRNQNMKKKKINHIRGLLVLGSLKNFRWSSEYGFKLRWHLALKTFAQIAGDRKSVV